MFSAKQGFFSSSSTPVVGGGFIASISDLSLEDIAIDSSDDIYLIGSGSNTASGKYICKFSGYDVSSMWQENTNNNLINTSMEYFSGNVFLSGTNGTAGNSNIATTVVNATTGSITYYKSVSTSGSSFSGLVTMSVNAFGNVIYSGSTGSAGLGGVLVQSTGSGTFTAMKQISLTGSRLTDTQYDTSSGSVTFCGSYPPSGNAVVATFAGVATSSLSLSSMVRFGTTTQNIVLQKCAISGSSKYFVGYGNGSGVNTGYLIKCNSTLSSISFQKSVNVGLQSIVADSGYIYISGQYVTGSYTGIYVACLNVSTNNIIWERYITTPGADLTTPSNLKVQGSFLYITGSKLSPTGIIIKLDTSGSALGTFIGDAGTFTITSTSRTYTTTTLAVTTGIGTLGNLTASGSTLSATWVASSLPATVTPT